MSLIIVWLTNKIHDFLFGLLAYQKANKNSCPCVRLKPLYLGIRLLVLCELAHNNTWPELKKTGRHGFLINSYLPKNLQNEHKIAQNYKYPS